jgi:methionine-rich copper-binding protein CopC
MLGRGVLVWRTALRIGGVAGLSLAALWSCSGVSSAHASLQRSIPADRAQLSAAPRQVELFFAQQLVQSRIGTFAVVLSPGGGQVSDEATIDPVNSAHLIVPLHGGLDNGVYTVFWKTTSDDDGGITLGSFTFFIGQPDQQTLSEAAAAGQVLVPDSARDRALSQRTPAGGSGGSLLAGLGLGGAAGLLLGGSGVWLLLSRRKAPAAATRPRRGRRPQ